MDKLKVYKEIGATMLFVGDDWYGTDKWQKYEEEFAKAGIKIVYFPYTKGVSSTKITETLKAVRGWTMEENKVRRHIQKRKDRMNNQVNKQFCMSSYLMYRYVYDNSYTFQEGDKC